MTKKANVSYLNDNYSWDRYLSNHKVNISGAEFFQKMWSKNWLRTICSVFLMWFLSALSVYTIGNVITGDNVPFWECFVVSVFYVIFMFINPEIFISGESFLYKWKAKKIQENYLKENNLFLTKKTLKNQELEIYEGLKQIITDLSEQHNLKELWSRKWSKIANEWNYEMVKYPGGFIKTKIYFMDDFAGKNYTVRSHNDVVSILDGWSSFEKRLDAVFVNRQCKLSEVKSLMNDFFFALLLKEELSRRYNQASALELRNKNMTGMTIVI